MIGANRSEGLDMARLLRRNAGIAVRAFGGLLVSCGLLAAMPVAVQAREAAEIRLLEQYFDAMRAKDRAAVEALIAPDAVFQYAYDRSGSTEPGSERRFVGRDAVMRDFVDRAFARLAKIDWFEPVYTVSADRRTVFVEVRGDMVLGTSTPYRNRYVIRFDLRKGRITGMTEYMNTVTATQAIEASGAR